MRTSDEIVTTMRIAEALLAVINQTPKGAPGERLYAALAPFGMSRADFKSMMRGFVEAERVTQQGDRYFPTEYCR